MTEKMRVRTRRFGEVEIDADTVFHFPQGLLGLDDCRRWCLLHHEEAAHLDWLQSIDDPEVALLLANPDDLFPDYDLHVDPKDIAPLELGEALGHSTVPPVVMRVVIRPEDEAATFVINASAPILFNVANRRGMQLALEASRLPPRYRGPIALCTRTEAPASV
jgi:flagellar assembly factor FliW